MQKKSKKGNITPVSHVSTQEASAAEKEQMSFFRKHQEFILYFLFGIITTVASLLACYLTLKFGTVIWHDEEGNPTAFVDILGSTSQWIVGVLVAFFTNKFWVFRSAEKGIRATFRQLCIFSGSRLGTYFLEVIINLGVIALLDNVFHYKPLVIPLGFMNFECNSRIWAKIVSSVVIVISNYFISKLVVFRKKKVE